MSHLITVACIQNNATPVLQDNLDYCSQQIRNAAKAGASFIATAEYFSGLKSDGARTLPVAFQYDEHPVIEHFQRLAVETNSTLLLGSVGVVTDGEKLLNRSVLIDQRGDVKGYYDKIHMFDVDLANGRSFRESATMQAGNEAKVLHLGKMTIGMSICYDLRFPHLYRLLAQSGANVLTVPAAFTHRTGLAHWQALLQARAIENSCYVIAPGQTGTVSGGGRHYGHSMIVSPWGEVLSQAGEEQGFIIAQIDLDLVTECRTRIPSLRTEQGFTLSKQTD